MIPTQSEVQFLALLRCALWEEKIDTVPFVAAAGHCIAGLLPFRDAPIGSLLPSRRMAVHPYAEVETNQAYEMLRQRFDARLDEISHNRERVDTLQPNFTLLNRMALNLVKNEKSTKTGVKGESLKAGWDNQYRMNFFKY